ncbi:MAG TPA: YggS family pyridoxal phosphate-dependent enzyme, partial [Methylophilaceae bacterium]|nr:YggS family pyridoxal phosphate-dependent enzyme [Methylophilaceae bacterium]
PLHSAPLNICLQINSSEEVSKGGASVAEVATLAKDISQLPNLKLRGLMAIPAPTKDLAKQHAQFKIVGEIYRDLQQQGFEFDTLSIGMSEDFEAAIAEGATIVRIGSAIFGERTMQTRKQLE